jgi:DNA-binding XRE family transcriptional regulator
MNQRTLAQRAGVDLATLRSIERGRGTVAPFIALLATLEYRFRGQDEDLDVGQWLAGRRRSAGLSQVALGKLARVSKPTIIQIERGQGHLGSLAAVLTTLRIRISLQPAELRTNEMVPSLGIKLPLRYPGAKTKALKILAFHFPDAIDEYREPFAGGASVAFFIASRHPQARIWINDAYTPLVSFWRVLQNPDRAAAMIGRVCHLKRTHPDAGSARDLFHRLRVEIDTPGVDDLTQAVAFYVLNRCSFSGLT